MYGMTWYTNMIALQYSKLNAETRVSGHTTTGTDTQKWNWEEVTRNFS